MRLRLDDIRPFDAIRDACCFGSCPIGTRLDRQPHHVDLMDVAGLPCVSLPLLETPDGLPIGVQLVGNLNADARLLRTAHWLEKRVLGGVSR